MSFTHASVIPLIGGLDIGISNILQTQPEYILSYSPFENNDSHYINYLNSSGHDVPYYQLDKAKPNIDFKVDIVSSTCPCAGLSMLSHGYGDDNENNKWMIETTKFILGTIKPRAVIAENAPGFAGKVGANVRSQMLEIADDLGYSMSVYRTKSLLHGVPQVCERSFYFFWEGDKVPVFDYISKPRVTIEMIS